MAGLPTQTSASASQLLLTLIPVLVVSGVFMLLFLALRKREARVYEPRSEVKTVPEDLRPEWSQPGVLGWATSLLNKPTLYIVQFASPDGYFFLRYLKTFSLVFLLGAVLTWVILFPVNATNSNHLKQLDILAFGNVKHKWRYLAHIFVLWVFFGGVIFVIYRELVYYTTFRHALQSTPLYDSLLLLRVLLLTEIPEKLLEESSLRSFFPTAATVWYGRKYDELREKVKERTKLAAKYEGALSSVLTKAVNMRLKCLKKNKPVPEPADELDKYLKDGKKRPTHRLKFMRGEKLDTLNYGAEHLGELNTEIKEAQADPNSAEQIPAVFIEFPTQLECQRAYQAIPYNAEFKGVGRHTGIAPEDVVWDNLELTKHKRRVKMVIARTVLTLMIIFWCIPIAVVGAISNINFLTQKLPWLKFINNMPSVLMGVITSLLPVVALAVLMLLVPPFIRYMGQVAGCITVQQKEHFCQLWFYAFQVVNSFIAMTLASAAAGSVQKVIEKPSSALTLLAQNLPKASNFYIPYICLYGLNFSLGLLLQLVALILSHVLGRILDKTPRAKWNRYTTLGAPAFSVLYPTFMLVLLIAIAYAIVAPLILGFATIGVFLIFVLFIYTFVHVQQPSKVDARGRNYALAMFQTFVAIYVAEVVLIGLFVMAKNWACVALESVWLAVTAVCHQLLKWRFLPILDTVPVLALKCGAGDATFQYPMFDQGLKEIRLEGEHYWEGGNQLGLAAETTKTEEKNEKELVLPRHNLIGPELAVPQSHLTLQRLFNPKLQLFDEVRAQLPACYHNYIEYNAEFVQTAYCDPAVTDEEPHIWMPRDEMGLSAIEKQKALDNGVDATDEDADFNEKGQVVYHGPPPAYEEALRV